MKKYIIIKRYTELTALVGVVSTVLEVGEIYDGSIFTITVSGKEIQMIGLQVEGDGTALFVPSENVELLRIHKLKQL